MLTYFVYMSTFKGIFIMSKEIRCIRCQGRKKLYKINSCYSHVNTGGVLVNCPMCLGTGSMKSSQEIIDEIGNKKNNVEEETTAICHDCLGETEGKYEVLTQAISEKLKDKRKSVKDDEKIDKEP